MTNPTKNKVKVAILGTGNIGTDLLIKVMRSAHLECSAFIGRSNNSSGLLKAESLGAPVSREGIAYLRKHPECAEIVFDATSAESHREHAPILKELGMIAIDLTPAKVGELCVPAVNLEESMNFSNVNMVTCGGQASLPIIDAIAKTHRNIEYIEVVSSIASRSAGAATRKNLDDYIHTTEKAISRFSGALRSKAILNLNPAQPCINMQTSILAKVSEPDIQALLPTFLKAVETVRKYVPSYEVLVGPTVENGRIVIMVRVKGLGDYLPAYAGNLDIINCAAIAVADQFAQHRLGSKP